MTEQEQARQQKSTLYGRIKQANADLISATDAAQRRAQRERLRLLRDMYKEACAEVRRLESGCPQQVQRTGKNGKKPPSRMESVMACGALWSDLEGVTWSRTEGMHWNDLPRLGTGRQMKQVGELVRAAMGMCTELQLRYLNAYYSERLTLEEIGERYGVDTSTVSRTLKRGRGRIEQYVTAKLLLGRCVDGQGRFDYMKFLNSARILTERQKEMVYLILARETSYRDIAEYLERDPSTVSRTADRVEEKLSILAVQVDTHWSAIQVERRDWAGRSEKQLAEDLGLSPAFYYRIVRRGERIGGLPLLYCAILRRLAAGESVECTAAGLGCSKVLVKRVRRHFGHLPLPDFTEDYHPKAVKRTRLPDNPLVVLGGGDAVIDRIDAATYRALQERFGGDSGGPRKTEWFCGDTLTVSDARSATGSYAELRTTPGTSETSRLRGGEGCGGAEDDGNT